MNKKIENFVRFYGRYISSYGPARIQSEGFADTYTIPFTESDFYNKLYVEVAIQSDLHNKLKGYGFGTLLALCGPAGSGKSTVSTIVKNKLEKDTKNLICFVDLRIEHSFKEYDDEDKIISEKAVRKLLLSEFRKKFSVDVESDALSERDKLNYFILSPERKYKGAKSGLAFNVFLSDVEKVASLYRLYGKDQQLSFEDWFYKNHHDMKELVDLIHKISDKLDIVHFTAYIKLYRKFEKIILWIDNLDTFANEQQIQISSFLQNVQTSILNSCQIVISVREENIYRIGYFTDSFTQPFLSKISFENPQENPNFTSHRAINMPVIDFDSLKTLIRNKISYAYAKFKSLAESKHVLMDDFFDSEVNVTKEFHLTEDELNEVFDFALKLVDCFDKEKIIFLANNSIREYLRIHADFFMTVYSSKRYLQEDLTKKEISNWQITTEFLSWVHYVNQSYKLETFNVFEETNRFNVGLKNKEIGCFLPYLILTRIWNKGLSLSKNNKPSPHNNPDLNFIVDDICKYFNFKRKVVLQAVYDLYYKVGGRSNFITFRTKEKISNSRELKQFLKSNDTTVRINYRGKVAAGSVINSFGYLRACSLEVSNNKLSVEKNVIANIEKISQIHLMSLQSIRDKNYPNNENWFESYLAKFGLPLEPEFVRNVNVGFEIDNSEHKRALYLQTTFVSLSSYFRFRKNSDLQSQINSIHNNFLNYLNGLKAGDTFESFNL